MEKSWIVYEHVHKETGRRYIGITSQRPEARWLSGKGYKPGTHIRAAIDLYGWDAFEHNILYENLTEEEAKEIEVKLIKEYNTTEDGFNLTAGGEDTGTGLIRSEEARSHMRKPHGQISDTSKMSEAKKGKHPNNYGKPRSEEAKTKQKITQTGQKRSEEAKANMKEAQAKRKNNPDEKEKRHQAALKREANKRAKREAQKAAES